MEEVIQIVRNQPRGEEVVVNQRIKNVIEDAVVRVKGDARRTRNAVALAIVAAQRIENAHDRATIVVPSRVIVTAIANRRKAVEMAAIVGSRGRRCIANVHHHHRQLSTHFRKSVILPSDLDINAQVHLMKS